MIRLHGLFGTLEFWTSSGVKRLKNLDQRHLFHPHFIQKQKYIWYGKLGAWSSIVLLDLQVVTIFILPPPTSPALDYKHFDLPKVENRWNLCRIQFEVKFKHPVFKPINQTLTCNTKRSNWSPSYTWLAGNAHQNLFMDEILKACMDWIGCQMHTIHIEKGCMLSCNRTWQRVFMTVCVKFCIVANNNNNNNNKW
jgi:hypothetical protein